jgi:hypothetical protein
VMDARAGDLNLATGAPWIAWGPYLWADGTTPRSDGLTWAASDFAADGTHPATSGRTKVADMLVTFFLNSPYTKCWFGTGCAAASVGGIAQAPALATDPSLGGGARVAPSLVAAATILAVGIGGGVRWALRRRRFTRDRRFARR